MGQVPLREALIRLFNAIHCSRFGEGFENLEAVGACVLTDTVPGAVTQARARYQAVVEGNTFFTSR